METFIALIVVLAINIVFVILEVRKIYTSKKRKTSVYKGKIELIFTKKELEDNGFPEGTKLSFYIKNQQILVTKAYGKSGV
jgi:hypothetical protein